MTITDVSNTDMSNTDVSNTVSPSAVVIQLQNTAPARIRSSARLASRGASDSTKTQWMA